VKGLTPLIASQSSAAAHRNTQHKRNEERTERRFTRHIAQYTQRHSRPAPGIYRALDKIDRYFHSIGDFRNGRFWLWNGVHALVIEWRRLGIIAHGQSFFDFNQSIRWRIVPGLHRFRFDAAEMILSRSCIPMSRFEGAERRWWRRKYVDGWARGAARYLTRNARHGR
jgi:hypothetical protein